jgi:hypothetical protein
MSNTARGPNPPLDLFSLTDFRGLNFGLASNHNCRRQRHKGRHLHSSTDVLEIYDYICCAGYQLVTIGRQLGEDFAAFRPICIIGVLIISVK